MRISAVITFSLLLLASNARAFDVEGFKTGMPKSAVLTAAEKSHRVTAVDDNSYVANASDGSYFSFNFCEERLVAIQQGFPASLQQVTLLISEFKRKYGNPFSTNVGTKAHSSGTVYEWGTWWNAGQEFVSLYYTGTSQGEGLSTSHQSKNKCFKVPR